jgi:hypothetical protein
MRGWLRGAMIGIVSFGVCGIATTMASAQTAAVDNSVVEFLGKDTVDIISTADRVESFQLDAKTDMKEPAVQGYPVSSAGPDLSLGQVEQLRTLVFSENSYIFDKSKRCPFLADYGFVFHAGERQASVALSMSCKLWSFARGAERAKIEDFDPAETDIKTLIGELFAKP